jgi:hypothetical protein
LARHASARLGLVAATAVLAAGLSPLLPSTAVADTPQESVVPATLRSTYLGGRLYGNSTYSGQDGAGAQGVFHTLEGSGLVWTRYADGGSVPVTRPSGGSVPATTGGDALAYRHTDGRIDLVDAADGTTRTLRVPSGLQFLTAYADLAVAFRNVTDENGTATRETHLLVPDGDGGTRDLPVTGVPEGLSLGRPLGGDADGLLFLAGTPGQFEGYRAVMVDRGTGRVTDMTPEYPDPYARAQVSGKHVALFTISDPSVLVFDRSDLSAAPTKAVLDGGGVNPTQDLVVVGDWLVHRPSSGTGLFAEHVTSGSRVTLAQHSSYGVSAAPDGTAVVFATGPDGYGVHRIQPGPDGTPVLTMVKALPKPPARIRGISLDQGRLVVADDSKDGVRDDYARTVAATGAPQFGERSSFTPGTGTEDTPGVCSTDPACSRLFGTADGRVAWMRYGSTDNEVRVNGPADGDLWGVNIPGEGRIVDVSGRYLLYTDPGTRYVYEIGGEGKPVAEASGAAAISGDVLWTTATTPGSLKALNLSTKTSSTVTTDAGCTPTEIQALGRYLYWTCDGRAGVYDRTAKSSTPVPTGEAKLGDGYVVTHDREAGRLTLTTVVGGTPVSRVIGDLPGGAESLRDVRWTVDESGSNAAFVDDRERVHLVPSGVPQQPLRLLGPARSAAHVVSREGDEVPDTLTTVLLSKPSASWRLTVRNAATGQVVDTRTGGAARGELSVGWAGRDATSSKRLPNGSYDWTLSVAPADGVGAALDVRGTVGLRKGSAVRRDHAGPSGHPDGIGDLLTLNSSGSLTFHQGTGEGGFSGKASGGGWATSVRPVPIGDLSGDRCNDVLVRFGSGTVRLYRPACGAALKPSTAYTTIATGSGWNQYDVLTSPGDVTRDGRPDLIARNSSTGAVYLYKGTSTGKLSSRVKLYDDWKTYKKIVGAGDLNGDGIGDLVAQDRSNVLYRYFGKGDGTFASRVKLFTDWGASYNAVVGVGDITGDGKADLVARDTAGNLYRQAGNGKGSFWGRVKIATGWSGYKGLF